MFESDDKKSLKQKYNKMHGVSAGGSMGKSFKYGKNDGPNSVYGELKLSDRLATELDNIKNHVSGLNENLEEALYEKE
jgi:hypothetical protein